MIILGLNAFHWDASAAWGRGSGAELEVEGPVYFPYYLGVFRLFSQKQYGPGGVG